MIDILFYIATFSGAGLMVYNIVHYFIFIARLKKVENWNKGNILLLVPGIFLVFFLIGYILVGIFGNKDLIVAGILLGGSIFVFLLLVIIFKIIRNIQETKNQLSLHFDEVQRENNELSLSALAAFSVNLSKDIIISVRGKDLRQEDVIGNSFSKALISRKETLVSVIRSTNTESFLPESLLKSYALGHEKAEELLLTRRDLKDAQFVRLTATMVQDPNSGDILAFIIEEEYSEKVIQDTILSRALSFRYDIVCSIVDGNYQLIASGQLDCAKAILPDSAYGHYDDFRHNHLRPLIADKDSADDIINAMDLAVVSKHLENQAYYEVSVKLQSQGQDYYKQFTYYNVTSDVPFIVLLVQDTTSVNKERALQNDRLSIALAEARSANAAKTVFFSNMSHDIRTPMNAIVGFTDLALHCNDLNMINEYLKKIDAASSHLLSLINDVLEVSRIEAGKAELNIQNVELTHILHDIKDMFGLQMEQKGIDFEITSNNLTHSYVLTDRFRINRILFNIVSNAYKFTPSGGKVTLSLTEEAMKNNNFANYVFRIKDTGIGMSEEFAKNVFVAYERERKSTIHEIQGTGLGMAITKSLVDLLGGTINVISKEGKGTEFIVSLQLEYLLSQDAKEETLSDEKVDYSFEGMRFLIADDNEINLEILALTLSGRGIEADMTTNGKEALDLLTSKPSNYYQAVLLDVQMPVMDGLEAARSIRALDDELLSNIPIFAFTANAFHEDVQMAIDAGMDGHIAKPIDPDTLFDTLAKVIFR